MFSVGLKFAGLCGKLFGFLKCVEHLLCVAYNVFFLSLQSIALDSKTQLLLFKMVGNGTLSEVGGCVSTGKEACVFHATGPLT